MHVAVIGGGPAGCACAIELARDGMPICLYETGGTGQKPGEVLAPSASADLEAIGFPLDQLDQGHLACTGIDRIWGTPDIARVDFSNRMANGWHLDRTTFEDALLDHCRAVGVRVETGVAFQTSKRTPEGWRVTLSDGTQQTVSHLVDASGRRAVVASQMNVRSLVQDRLVAFHLVVPTSEGGAAQPMFIEAVENGWWYTTPLSQGRRVFAFLTDSDLPAALHAAKPEGFRTQLKTTRIARHFFPSIDPIAPNAYSAVSRRLETFCGPGWLAIGDAAISRDPLSGGGIAHALQDGRSAASTIKRSLSEGDAAFSQVNSRMQSIWDAHEGERQAMYMTEERWTWSPFWARRSNAAEMAQEG